MFSLDTQREINASYEAVRNLQSGWPEAIGLGLFRQTIWYELPYAFLPAFPALSVADVRELTVFGRLLASSIFIHDPLADRAVGVHETAIATLRIMAMQLEAFRALQSRISPSSPFWERLRQYLSEYASACVEELRFSAGARPWRELTAPVAYELAIRKSGPSRAIIAGLVALAQAEELLEPLVATLDHFNIACQLWDDVKDWRDDLSRRTPTLLLTRVLATRPELEPARDDLPRVAMMLYREGHASYVLDLALESIASAERVKARFPSLPWWHLMDATRAKLLAAQREIDLALPVLARVPSPHAREKRGGS
jgi:hypothetical protein